MRRILVSLGLIAMCSGALAQVEFRVGFVDAVRIMRESAPAVRAQKKLDKEFEKRSQDLQRLEKQLQGVKEQIDRNGLSMAETDRRLKDKELGDLMREFERKRREYHEDRNQRQNEELAGVLDRANKTIRQVAEAEKFDLIVQEAVYFNPRIDITDKVIKALADTPGK